MQNTSAPVAAARRPGRQPARETPAVASRLMCREFIGRADELAALGAAFASVAAADAATVLIGGEAGMGKTRLVQELCDRARRGDALVATGVCLPVDGAALPYLPVVGMIRDLAGQLGESAASAVLGALAAGHGLDDVGVVHPVDVYSALPRVADEMSKTRLFESILACCTRAAERTPIVLVFEDVQWADSGTAALLSFLTRNLTDTRVLLLCTYRSDELRGDHRLGSWLAELGRHARITHLHLDGFDRDQVTAQIRGLIGGQPDWALVDGVMARSQGNPFFVEELVAARHGPALSAELRGVLMTRVEALSKDVQRLVRAAAVVGPTTEHRMLLALELLAPDEVEEALAEAVEKQVLAVDPGGTGYQFRHALLREVVEASVLPGERRRLHLLVARALDADPTLGPAEPGYRAADLAAHWWAADQWAEALQASMSAAEAAMQLWAFPEAHEHLERALSALDRLPRASWPADIDRLAVLEQASEAAYLAGAGQRSIDLARDAIASAQGAIERLGEARLHTLVGRNAWAVGDSDAAFVAYRQAAALVPADAPSLVLVRVLAEEARGLMLMSRFREAELVCQHALELAGSLDARAEEGHIRCTLGCCRAALGSVDEGLALVREALRVAEDVARPDDVSRAYGNLGSLLMDSGRLEDAVNLLYDNAKAGEELWGIRLNGAAGNGVEALIRLARYDEADALLAQLGNHALGVCAPGPYLLPASISIRRSSFDEAASLLAIADELTAGLSDVQQRGSFHTLSAELALDEGRPDDAYDHVERALGLAAGTDDETSRPEMCALGVRSLADALDDARSSGRRSDAAKARLLATGLVEEIDRIIAVRSSRGGVATPRVEAFRAMGVAELSRLGKSDPDLWRDAVRRWGVAGEPYPTAYCRLREAEALLAGRGERSRAAACLQSAWEESVDMGAVGLRQKVERLAQRARVPLQTLEPGPDPTEPTVAADFGLTPREVEVLRQLAAGRTDREIGELLFISKKTASVHVSNLLRKLDVPNRIEAGRVAQAHQLG